MASQKKKTVKRPAPPKTKRHKLFIPSALALLLILITTLAILTYITQKNHQQAQHITALRTEITTVHHELGTIAKDLERQTGYMWKDESECYVLVSRQFGDREKYACEVSYTTHTSDGRTLLDRRNDIKIDGLAPDYSRGFSAMDHEEYGADIRLSHGSGTNCGINITYDTQVARTGAYGSIRCIYHDINPTEYKTFSEVLGVGASR